MTRPNKTGKVIDMAFEGVNELEVCGGTHVLAV
jgi:hypothetical protein